ncbi:hypothetical protein ACO1O0_003209 [Amphichorda felina]
MEAPRNDDRNGRQTRDYETETGESSTVGSLRDLPLHDATPSTGRRTNPSSNGGPSLDSSPAAAQTHGRVRRRDRIRSAGGFLLHDAVASDRDQGTRRRTRSLLQHKGKGLPQTPENPSSSPARQSSTQKGSVASSEGGIASPAIPANKGRQTATPDGHPPKAEANPSPATQSPPSLDVDSAQIVNMALNLSESRRLASRRTIPRSNPPRLVPLPDSASGSNLKQHFQQQRKTSRTGSPRPNQAPSPRIPSGFKANSPLQSGFDSGQDAHFRYHFSPLTLARAQKAKEHLELMAEYRRLLEALPPLKPSHDGQPAGSPPSSPGPVPKSHQLVLGRPYNPLQYVRNRKVRSRERKVIDGEQQGFSDVEAVRDWVNRIRQRNFVIDKNEPSIAFAMPNFPGADDPEGQASPEPASKQALRARRPRVDWFIDPCDMIADAYWLEQDHHKQLIEDRLWRKIFPALPISSRPVSRQVEETDPGHALLVTKTAEEQETHGMHDMRLVHTEDGTQGRARERARQKLHGMKGFHHRHSSSLHGTPNFQRLRRESLSDASGSEGDLKELKADSKRRIRRRETITSDANDLLKKQMMNIVAQEAREKELANVPETEAEHHEPDNVMSPERTSTANTPSQSHSRKTSVADFSDPETRLNHSRSRLGSPTPYYRRGRPSLEVPEDPRRGSIAEIYQSVPSSPKPEDGKDYPFPAQTGVNMSVTSSRSGSPTRNPLSKVKRKLREKSRDRESQSDLDNDTGQQASIREQPSLPEENTLRPTDEGHKTHRRTSSMRSRGDDQFASLRGLFRSPRIDTVLRGSVSKLGDIIWRKDASDDSSDDSSSESDVDVSRGRSRPSTSLSGQESRQLQDEGQKGAKHFYDAMPQFHHVGDPRSSSSTGQKLGPPGIPRSQSRQSARWEQLKPPRIDISSASPTPSPSGVIPVRPGESDVSDTESNQNSVAEGTKAADQRLSAVLKPHIPGQTGRSPSRQWSITDRSPFPERAQLSKREIARMRALILSSGVKAMEINRRANEMCRPLSKSSLEQARTKDPRGKSRSVSWADIAKLTPNQKELHEQQVPACDTYPLASRALGIAIQTSGQRWQASADRFTSKTSPELQRRIWTIRSHITDDLSEMARSAADEADETNRELALDQPLRIKHVIDVIEKLLRKRRRRFRWLRRGLWLAVEWVLVGFMWYVWFVVMILRVVLGLGKGVWGGVRWLLWL